MIQSVFFDVGGVLGESLAQCTYEKLRRTHVHHHRLRRLLHDERVLTGPAGTLDSLLKTEFRDVGLSSMEIFASFENAQAYPENIDIARDLKSKGIVVGIISEQIAESASLLQKKMKDFEGLFELVLLSPYTGLTKKSRHIFDMVRERVGYEAHEMLMIDDSRINIKSAKAAGWNGIHYAYPRSLKERIQEYGI